MADFVVASWPGAGFAYVRRFIEALNEAGVATLEVTAPWRALTSKVDIFHLHWPEHVFWGVSRARGIFNSLLALICLTILRIRRIKIVWCVHNLDPHDASGPFLAYWCLYAGAISRLAHGFVTLSPSTVPIVRAHFPALRDKPGTFVWHPPFHVHRDPVRGGQWRDRHGIASDMTLFAFIGAIKGYKGVEELASAFSLTFDKKSRLVVAGQVGTKAILAKLYDAQRNDSRILLELKFLSDAELEEIALAADVIVLPFTKILHSGSLLYALSCAKPVLTPESAFANDYQTQVGKQWVNTYTPPLSPKELRSVFRPREVELDLNFCSDASGGSKLKNFYLQLLEWPIVRESLQ